MHVIWSIMYKTNRKYINKNNFKIIYYEFKKGSRDRLLLQKAREQGGKIHLPALL